MQDGRTALMFAAERGHTQCANLLVKAGASLGLKDLVRIVSRRAFMCGEVQAVDYCD